MPWEAPFVKVGKGASSGDAVDGCGEETGQGRAGNLVGKILILKSVIWRLRALAAIVCTCPVLRRDCAASSFWAGKENIILEV